MPNTGEIMELQKLSGMEKFSKRTIAEELLRSKLVELVTAALCNQSAEEVADHLISNGVTVNEWISVKDRLPEGDKVVLCYKADRGIRFGKLLDATYANGVQAFMDRDRTFAFGVTHWMPLPQPPKGE